MLISREILPISIWKPDLQIWQAKQKLILHVEVSSDQMWGGTVHHCSNILILKLYSLFLIYYTNFNDWLLILACYRTLWAQLVSLLPQIHDLILFFAVNNVKRNEIVFIVWHAHGKSIVLEKQIQFLFLGIFKGIIEF